MLKRKIMVLSIFLVFLLLISAVNAEGNDTDDIVSTSDDDTYTVSDDFKNKTTFGGLVYNLGNSSEGNVYLNKDYKFAGSEYDIDPISGLEYLVVDEKGINISGSLTIHGNGHTIDANNTARIFNINGNNVILKDINFINAKNIADNSPIVWNGYNGLMDNCTFSNFKSDVDGGAVIWIGDKGSLTNCEFKDCYAINAGGVLWSGNDGIISNSNFNNCTPRNNAGSLKWTGDNGTVKYSNFTNAKVNNGNGGAIVWEGENGTLDYSNFINVTCVSVGATSGGGAIYWSSQNAIISNSNFINTSNNWQGGAINLHNANGNIINCNFQNSTAGSGGAVYIHSTNSSIINSNFSQC